MLSNTGPRNKCSHELDPLVKPNRYYTVGSVKLEEWIVFSLEHYIACTHRIVIIRVIQMNKV